MQSFIDVQYNYYDFYSEITINYFLGSNNFE